MCACNYEVNVSANQGGRIHQGIGVAVDTWPLLPSVAMSHSLGSIIDAGSASWILCKVPATTAMAVLWTTFLSFPS